MAERFQHISSETRDGVLVLTLFDQRITEYDQSKEIADEFVAAMSQTDAKNVVLDTANLEFLSSVGYIAFLRLNRVARDAGGQLVLCHLSKLVSDALKATHLLISPKSLTSVFQVAETVDEALAALKA